MHIVNVENLSKLYGERTAVRSISFRIDQGECLGFLGPNGAGKTTTIQMLQGLVRKSAGSITIFGMPITGNMRRIKARMGVAPQADSLDPDLTVSENLFTYGAYFTLPKHELSDRTAELLHFFALHSRRHETIGHLSGGQRRRLLLARALINRPDLLILDEPTIGLDPQARHLIWDRLGSLREQGTTMLLTSHYMEEVSRLCNRVLIMDQGAIVMEGEPQHMVTDMVGIDVFEVEGSAAELDTLERAVSVCKANTERVADKLFIYTREDCPELEALVRPYQRWVRRPASLEDLFIQATGRSLRET